MNSSHSNANSMNRTAAVREAPAAGLEKLPMRCGWVCDHDRGPTMRGGSWSQGMRISERRLPINRSAGLRPGASNARWFAIAPGRRPALQNGGLCFRLVLGLLGAADSVGAVHGQPVSPLVPAQERASFRFADENLVAELVAAEPNVVSPVALGWDADGRLFVAEMSDYPNAPTGGRIKLLEDGNGDGLYE